MISFNQNLQSNCMFAVSSELLNSEQCTVCHSLMGLLMFTVSIILNRSDTGCSPSWENANIQSDRFRVFWWDRASNVLENRTLTGYRVWGIHRIPASLVAGSIRSKTHAETATATNTHQPTHDGLIMLVFFFFPRWCGAGMSL